MLSNPTPHPPAAEDEYLRLEASSEIKHELVGGKIVAMSGASRRHSLINTAIFKILVNAVGPDDCEIHVNDMRLNVDVLQTYTYPDLMLVCGDAHMKPDVHDTLLNPTLIVEVLSPSTAMFDRGPKCIAYRSIPSLQDILLVHQHEARVEHDARQDAATWVIRDISGIEEYLTLHSLRQNIALRDIYQKVTFDTP